MNKTYFYKTIITLIAVVSLGFVMLDGVITTGNAVADIQKNIEIKCCSECISKAGNSGLSDDCSEFAEGECINYFNENKHNVEECRLN
ncbi:MAG: hypothetical protein PHW96_00285 [Candidatus Nanoarchaeia archaeon]|nr:hypothetical protein [Candidatus Nanoarchaeia archaeon]